MALALLLLRSLQTVASPVDHATLGMQGTMHSGSSKNGPLEEGVGVLCCQSGGKGHDGQSREPEHVDARYRPSCAPEYTEPCKYFTCADRQATILAILRYSLQPRVACACPRGSSVNSNLP